jgi:hypothetical protein
MTGRLTKVAMEAIKIGEEVVEHLPQGHHGGHLALERDAQRMARDVDDAEAMATAHVPGFPGSTTRFRLGQRGVPGWATTAHVFHGHVSWDGKRLSGYHHRWQGADGTGERFDESSRVDFGNGFYGGEWQKVDTDGNVLKKPNGSDLRKYSTFWPDDWSHDDVSAAVARAFLDAAVRPAGLENGTFRGYVDRIPVRGHLDADGRIVTAFADFPKPKVKHS